MSRRAKRKEKQKVCDAIAPTPFTQNTSPSHAGLLPLSRPETMLSRNRVSLTAKWVNHYLLKIHVYVLWKFQWINLIGKVYTYLYGYKYCGSGYAMVCHIEKLGSCPLFTLTMSLTILVINISHIIFIHTHSTCTTYQYRTNTSLIIITLNECINM